MAIGDGYNDIGMIRNSNIGVCVKNANNQNVRVNSDIIVDNFEDLTQLLTIGYNSYYKNSFISLFFFLSQSSYLFQFSIIYSCIILIYQMYYLVVW